MLAEKYGIERVDMERLAYTSHKRAAAATAEGRFRREIVSVKGEDRDGNSVVHDADEGIRPNATLASMARLPTLKEGGRITAATSSQICDGAAALLICNERGLRRLGLKPRARIVALSLAGTGKRVCVEMEKGRACCLS